MTVLPRSRELTTADRLNDLKWGREQEAEATRLRAEFVAEFGVRECKWSAHSLARMLNATGETPERIKAIRAILGEMGMGRNILPAPYHYYSWICTGGVFDHGEAWSRNRVPVCFVGHPYQINAEEHRLLSALAQFPTLRVSVDDRASYYAHGTHHIRIEAAS